jgi:hypothetical protein
MSELSVRNLVFNLTIQDPGSGPPIQSSTSTPIGATGRATHTELPTFQSDIEIRPRSTVPPKSIQRMGKTVAIAPASPSLLRDRPTIEKLIGKR